MIRWMVRSSLQARFVVVALAALLLVFGFTQLKDMPVDILPEFSPPYVELQIEALGLSAQEVEAMITTPLEADMLNGTPWAKKIRSVSLPGLSSITLMFEEGTDIMHARQVAQERLIEIFALPQVSNQFTMINPVSSAGRVMDIGLVSDKLSLIEMSVLARWTIVPRLMGLPGVANVSIWGERERQLQVQVNPERLGAEGLTLMQIIKTAGNSLWSSPLSFLEASTPGTGGWIETPNQRLGVRHILPIKTAEDLAKVPIEGAPLKRLGDVVKVVEDHQPLIGDAIVKQTPSLTLVVEKFPWSNTKDVTEQVETALIDLRPAVSGMEMDPTLFRPATYIALAIDNLSSALLIGAVFIVAAFLAFLLSWRTALINTVAVLISIIAAGTVFYVRGVTINMIIIAGLMIALGVIIDDAIVDMENIVRRLRRAREEDSGKSATSIIYQAVIEMRSPLVYATVIMVLAVLPALFLEGLTGALWQPVATSYMLALLASFVVALTVTPTLSVLLLRNTSLRAADPPVMTLLRSIYSGLFGWAARRPRAAFVAICVVIVAGLAFIPFLRQESLLQDFKETDLLVRMEGNSSASHPAMSRIIKRACSKLRAIPGVRNVSALMGRAIMSDKHTNINASEAWVSINPSADYDATVAEVRRVVAAYPSLSPQVLTYLQAQVREKLFGTGKSLVVRVYGEDLNVMYSKAEEVQRVLAGIKGIVDATAEYPPLMPSLEIEVDVEKANLYNLKPGDVRRGATSLVSGIVVGSLFEEQKVFDVVVWGTPETRHSISSVQNLLIDAPSGGHVRLQEVADVRIVPSVTKIHRDAVARYMDVTANVRGRDFAAVGDEIEDRLEQVQFPLEYRAELMGEYAERDAAEQRLITYAITAAIGIFLLLQVFFRSWRLATAVFLTLPMALVGGVLTAFLTNGGLLSFGAFVGFIAVLGIVVRNVITLISRYYDIEREGENFGAKLVQSATREQSAPILMTAVTTTLALLPLLFFGKIAGLEIVQPMAIVVLGGLVTATVYTLAGVPALYLLFGAAREPELELPGTLVVTEEERREAMART